MKKIGGISQLRKSNLALKIACDIINMTEDQTNNVLGGTTLMGITYFSDFINCICGMW